MRAHNSRTIPTLLITLLTLLLVHMPAVDPARAGGPLRVGGPGFGPEGTLTVFTALPIPYRVDQGPLGLDTEAATTARVNTLFAVWQAVPTSSVAFINAGTILAGPAAACVSGDGDVDTVAEFNCVGTNGSPIIYDNNGAIHDSLFGVGNSTLGFAGPTTTSIAGIASFTAARAVMNGKFRDGINIAGNGESSDTEFEATFLHEFGHFFGMGHSQINVNCLVNPFVAPCNNFGDDTFGLPTMFPISISGLEESAGVSPERTLSLDDVAWVSRLYPDATFATTHGTISGTVFFTDGLTHAQGVNVIARQVDIPGGFDESRRNAFSVVSGYLYTENLGQAITGDNPGSTRGSTNPALRGTFDIPVAAGVSYNIEIEAVDGSFVSGSSVGPLTAAQFPLPGGNPGPINGVGPIVANSTTGGNNFILAATAATRDASDAAATNDTIATRTSLGNGTTSRSISPFGNISATAPDIDVYGFTAPPGGTVNFEIFARRAPVNGLLDSVLEIVDGGGVRQNLCGATFTSPCLNDDITPVVVKDSLLQFQSAAGGTFFLRVFDWRGEARPDLLYNLVVTGAGAAPPPVGCTSDFDGGGASNDWNTAANWNPDGLPGAGSDVCIGAAFAVDHAGTDTINSLANVAGTLNITGGTLTVTSSTAIGGSLNVLGGTLNTPASNIASLTMTNGVANFTGPAAFILGLTFNGGTLNATSGTVTLPAAGYNHTNGALRLVGGSVTTAGTINFSGGLLEGGAPGTLSGNLNQTGGTISPGVSPGVGVMNMTGNFTQALGAGNIVFLEIAGTGGPGAVNGHDQLNITGNATTDGAFNVVLIGGFTPALGNSFTVATASGATAGNNTLGLPTLGGGLAFTDANSTNNALILDVILATKDFDGGGDGTSWTDPANWVGNTLPGPTDNVVIGSAAFPGPFTVTKNGAGGDSINSLTIANGQGVFTLGNASLNIAAASTIGTGGFAQTGGTLTGAGTLTITGLFTWSGGTQDGTGTTNAAAGMNITGNVNLIGSRVLNTAGVSTWSAGTIQAGQSSTWNNSGTLNVTGNNTINNAFGGAHSFTNTGTVTKMTGVGATDWLVAFNNNGIVNADSGTLNLGAGGTSAGTGVFNVAATLGFAGGTHTVGAGITGAGTVVFSSGTVDVNGPYNVTGASTFSGATANFNAAATVSNVGALSITTGTANFSSGETITAVGATTQSGGTLTGSDLVQLNSLFTWSGGTQQGTGTTNAAAGVNITGNVNLIGSRVLNTTAPGVTTWSAGTIQSGNSVVWNNTGDLNITGNNTINNAFGGSATFTNSGGTVTKMTGVGVTDWLITYNSTGPTNANSGTLNLGFGGSSSGGFNVAATLAFSNGTHTVFGAVTGAGTVLFSGSTTNINGTYNITGGTSFSSGVGNFNPTANVSNVGALSITGGTANFSSGEVITAVGPTTQSGGVLEGSDQVQLNALFTWSGGTQQATGTTVAAAGVNITGNVNLVGGRTLNTSGVSTWSAGNIQAGQSSAWNNPGTLNVTGNNTINNAFGGTTTFTNNGGTVTKMTGLGITDWLVAFNNNGIVNADSGTLNLGTGGNSPAGVFNVAATLGFTGGSHTVSGAISGAGTVVFSGGDITILGPYNITGGSTFSGANPANFSGLATVSNVGALSITAGIANFSSGETITATGAVTQSGGTLDGSDLVQLNNLFTWSGGTQQGTGTTNAAAGVNISGNVNLIGSRVLNTAGVSTWSAGTIQAGQSSAWNNPGTLNVTGNNTINNAFGGAHIFTNTGTVTKMTGVGATDWLVAFNNVGITNASSGTLNLGVGGTSAGTGTFNVAAALGFTGGTHTVGAGITGAGTVVFSSGTVDVNGPYDVTGASTFSGATANFNAAATVSNVGALSITAGTANFSSGETITAVGATTQSGGTLTGSDLVQLNNLFTWSGGTQQGTGTTNAAAGVNITGNVNLIGSRVLNSVAVSTWSAGTIQAGQSSAWNNSGTLNITGNNTINNAFGGALNFTNTGTVTKMTGVGVTDWATAFNSSGTLNANSGTLNFTIGFTQTAGTTSLNGGALAGGITFNFNGGVLSAIGGSTITGNVNNAGATVRPGTSPGVLNIVGNYINGAGGTLEIELAGVGGVPGTDFDRLAITGTATLNGTLSVLPFGGFSPGAGVSFQVMTFASGVGDFATKNGLNIASPPLIGLRQATNYLLSNALDADMSITKTDAPDPVIATQNVTYTITVSNAGPGPGTTVVMNDPLPASTTFVSVAAPAGWACTTPAVGAGGTVNCTNPSVAVATPQVFTLVVATTGASAPSISNTATIAAVQVDPNAANNTATATTAVTILADLAVTKTDAPDPIILGTGNITYTVTVSNAGPNDATGVTLTDTLPAAGTSFVSATPSQGTCPAPVAGVLTCNLGTINNAANATVSIILTPTATGVLTNTVSATSAATDPVPANNTNIAATTTVNAQADLSTTKVDTVDPVVAGNNITYQLSVTNAGPSPATNVVLTDTLPGNVTFVSVGAPCTQAAGIVTCNFGALAFGATTAVVNLVVATNGGSVPTVNNTAVASATEPDPVAANNTAAQSTTVTAAANLAVAITDAPDPVNVNANVTYTATVSNAGPSNASGVSLANTLPANVAFVSATPAQGTCGAPAAGVVTCNLGAINNGANATVAFVVTPGPAAVPTASNSATVTATEFDPVAANNTAAQSTTVNPIADLSITKTDAPDPVNVGSNVTYTITVSNAGPSPAAAATVADALPAGLTFVSATPSVGTCTGTTTVSCNLGAINSGASATVTIVATATATAAASTVNTATVASTTTDLNAANNSAAATTTVNPIADVSVTVIDAPDPVSVNSSITYTVTVRNNGPSSAANVTATTALPANTTFVSATASAGTCILAASTITCNIGTMASGATVTATVIVTATAVGTVNATINVTTTTTDPNAANNSAAATTTVTAVQAATDFSLTVTPTAQYVVAGQGTSFAATVTPSVAGSVFTNAVTFSCLVSQQVGVACAVSPASVAAGATVANSTINITTVARATTAPFRGPSAPGPWPLGWLLAMSMVLAGVGFAGRKLAAQAAAQRRWAYCYSLGMALLVLSMAMTQGACGQDRNNVPRGPVAVSVTATSGSVSRTAIVNVILQ